MKIQLCSIDHAPRSVPPWPLLMADLCHPPAARVARVLGLSERSVRRYNATAQAPRAICLALFWLTSWGRSAVHSQAINDAQLAISYVAALRRRVGELEDAVEHLNALNTSGAANDPLAALNALAQRVAPALPVQPLSPRPRGRGLSTRRRSPP